MPRWWMLQMGRHPDDRHAFTAASIPADSWPARAARHLLEVGVRVVFGYPSVGADALLDHLAGCDRLRAVVAASESAAAAAAHSYAALSHRPGAVVVDPAWAIPELTRYVRMASREGLPVVYVLPEGGSDRCCAGRCSRPLGA